MLERPIQDLANTVMTVMLVLFLGGLGLVGGHIASLVLRGVGDAARGVGTGLGEILRGVGNLIAGVGSGIGGIVGVAGELFAGDTPPRARGTRTLVDYVPPPARERKRFRLPDVGVYVGLAGAAKVARAVGRIVRRVSTHVARGARRVARRVQADARATWRASTARTWYTDASPLWEWGVPPHEADTMPVGTMPVEIFDPETGEWLTYYHGQMHTPDPSKGGRALVARYGREYMRALGRRGGLARWGKE